MLFVAAVGFGPLPGILALASHSTGVLGKFFAEILEHADPAPGDALRSHGVSRLGVLRYSVLPQILPRLVDATVYRWDIICARPPPWAWLARAAWASKL